MAITHPRSRARATATALTPGPQVQLTRSVVGSVLLGSLIALLSVISLYALLQANFTAPPWFPDVLRGWKILDVNNALTLLIALLTLVGVRQQFIATLKPYLSYSSHSAPEPTQLPKTSGKVWKVDLNNAGTGLALVTDAKYRVAFGAEPRGHYSADYDEMVKRLRERGLVYGTDYVLQRISQGAILGSAATLTVFELRLQQGRPVDLSTVDIRIEFESRSRERFAKEIFCIPRNGVLAPLLCEAAEPPKKLSAEAQPPAPAQAEAVAGDAPKALDPPIDPPASPPSQAPPG